MDTTQKAALIISTVGALASIMSMILTASIALKANGRVVRAIEKRLNLKFSD